VYQDGVSETRKRGTPAYINDDWRDDVEAAMAKKRPPWKKKDLAAAVGCDPTIISLVLKRSRQKGSVESSKWAQDITDKLKVQLPIKVKDWRSVILEKAVQLQKQSQQEFEDSIADFEHDLERRLTRATARPLKSDPDNAVESPHGGSSDTSPEEGPLSPRPPRPRR
jgi:hypothetical protein